MYLIYLVAFLFLKLHYKSDFSFFKGAYIDDRVIILFFLLMLLLSIVNIEKIKKSRFAFRINLGIKSSKKISINIGTTLIPMFFCAYLANFIPLIPALIVFLLVFSIPQLLNFRNIFNKNSVLAFGIIIILSVILSLLIMPGNAGPLIAFSGIFGLIAAGNILKSDKKNLQIGGSGILNAIIVILLVGLAL